MKVTVGFPIGWKLLSFSVTLLIVVFCIGSPFGGPGGGVEARRKYTYLNKWYKVACIAENLKETDHYICDEHGYIRCLPGWTNEHLLCTVPQCGYDCENGNCTGPDTCTCDVGWTSANCSQCICLPGCDKGYCELPFECKCKAGWTGMLCNKPICKPGCIHGHCNAPGECVCHPGWTGENCSECLPLPGCHWNNGYCSKPMECKCRPGYHGNFCKHANCTPGCHPQYGYCINPDTCWCHTGWNGPTCSQCSTYPGCVNGYCNLPWECICESGWHGKLCDQKGDGTTTPSYTEYSPGHGSHHNFEGHAQHIGKRDTDIEEEKEAITEVTRILEDNGVISSENEEADIDVTTKTFSVAATEATANPKPLFEPVEDLAFTISEDTPVSSTMKFN